MMNAIGSRWTPEHIERRDTATGFYECVNSPMESRTEMEIQRALLAGKGPTFTNRLEWTIRIQIDPASPTADIYQQEAIDSANSATSDT